MKSFFSYAKNRFLYNLLRFLIILILGILASQFLYIPTVKAEEVDYSTNYYYSNTSDITYTTGFRSGDANNVMLFGKEDYAPTYDEYEYITGFDNYISYSVSNGTTYTVKVFWSATSVSEYVFIPGFIDSRLGGLSYVAGVNGIITYQKTTYNKNNCMTYMSDEYCTYNFITTYTFNATTNANAFRVGTYNNNAYSLYGSGNYLTQLVSVNSIDVIVNADNTIINQNEQIIDQNQTIIDNSNQTNEKIDETNEKLEEAEETRKGIWATIKDLPNKLLDLLKSLFIPDDGFFKNWFDEFMDFVELKLGFLATPFTIFIDFIESYLNLDSSADVVINIPDISVPNFEDNIIVHATTFNWSETLRSKDSLNNLWQLYLDFVDVFLILNFIGLCESVYNRIFGGNTSNYEYYTVEDSYTYDNETGEVLSSRRNERTTTRKKVDS